MVRMWSHRPKLWHLALFFAAYVVGCGFAESLRIVPGITVSIWPPAGIFIATLILTSPYSWPWWMLAGCLAEMFAQFVWFHSPLPAGLLIYVGNALAAAFGASLVNRVCGRPVQLETLREVIAFVVSAAGIAPLVSATIGSAVLAWFDIKSQSFTAVWPLFWIGDATGVLLVAPLALVVLKHWHSKTKLSAAQRVEAGVLGLIFLGVAALSMSAYYLPFAYIIMPPLLWAAVRFEFKGVAVALTLLALITMALTISGDSQFVGDSESQREKQIMLQLFLVISAFSALIVAAISRQHQQALFTLRESERKLQQLIDAVPVMIWSTTDEGQPSYVNKRFTDVTGATLNDITGPNGSFNLKIIHPDDKAVTAEAISCSFETGAPYVIKYRQLRNDGTFRWTETRAEALRDDSGKIIQWYGASTDIDDLVNTQEALQRNERKLQQLIDTVPAIIWCATPEGIPSYLNKQAMEATGTTLKDLTAPDGSRSLTVIHPDDRDTIDQALAHSFKTGTPFLGKFRSRRANGSYRWTESRAQPLRDDQGNIVQWYGVSVDIDDLVTAQEALHDSERELSQLVNLVPVHIRRLTADGEPIFFNKRLVDFYGLDISNLDKPGMGRLAATIQTLVHPDDATELLETARHSFAHGSAFSMKYRTRRADGVYRWVDTRAEPLRNEGGAIIQWYVVSLEVDDEMRAQQALHRREWELSQLVDMVPSLLWRLDPKGEPNFFNKRTKDFLGLDAVDYDKPGMSRLQATLAAIVHPEDAANVTKGFSHSFVTGEPFSMTYRLRRADGVYRWMSARAEPLLDENGRIIQWYGLAHDIDDQMRAEETLRQSERRLQQMIDAVPVHILSFSAAGEPTYINKRYQDYLGISISHFDSLQEQQRALIHPDDFEEMYGTLSHCFRTGTSFLLRYRRRGKDGAYRWTEGRAEPLRDQDGMIVQWYAVSLDIEDEMRAQEALRQSERSLRQLVETLPAMIYCSAPDGEPTYRSRQLREFLGFKPEDVGKIRLIDVLDKVIHTDDIAAVKSGYARSLQTGAPYALRHRLRRADGEYRWVETRAAPMRNADGEIVQWNGICLDIEDQVRAQEKLSLAQKNLARASQAASLAELSASIAHEVNQPLAAVVANSHACQRWLKSDPPNLERAQLTAERIIQGANSAADVVSRIRALFKQSVDQRISTALHSVIAEARNLIAEETVRRRVRMDMDIESDLPLVMLDRVQIQQVLINLVRNGIDAMDSAAGESVLNMRVRRIGDFVQIEVSDRGYGIEFPDKIFEPFFTTKAHGMGMGLAICRSIVESHGGKLWAEKNEPHGAKFIFTVPIEMKAEP